MPFQETKAEFSSLSPEIVQHISFFLRPRHLCVALQTSKGVKKLLDREEYWARVGFHAIYRHFDFVSRLWNNKESRLPGMYAMYNLDMCYYDAMNLFISKVRKSMENAEPEWRLHKDDSLPDLVRLGVTVMINEHKRFRSHEKFPKYAECNGDIKQIVRSDVYFMTYDNDKPCKVLTRRFQRSIVDDPDIPSAAKKAMIEKFRAFFAELDVLQDTETNTERPVMTFSNLGYCVSHFV
jgi:hypothetical protein